LSGSHSCRPRFPCAKDLGAAKKYLNKNESFFSTSTRVENIGAMVTYR